MKQLFITILIALALTGCNVRNNHIEKLESEKQESIEKRDSLLEVIRTTDLTEFQKQGLRNEAYVLYDRKFEIDREIAKEENSLVQNWLTFDLGSKLFTLGIFLLIISLYIGLFKNAIEEGYIQGRLLADNKFHKITVLLNPVFMFTGRTYQSVIISGFAFLCFWTAIIGSWYLFIDLPTTDNFIIAFVATLVPLFWGFLGINPKK